MIMLENNFAAHFAADWIDSWNSHDLGRTIPTILKCRRLSL